MTLLAILLATLFAGIGSVWLAAGLLRMRALDAQGASGVGASHLLSLAAGALLATAFMHLLPEAYRIAAFDVAKQRSQPQSLRLRLAHSGPVAPAERSATGS